MHIHFVRESKNRFSNKGCQSIGEHRCQQAFHTFLQQPLKRLLFPQKVVGNLIEQKKCIFKYPLCLLSRAHKTANIWAVTTQFRLS